MRQTTIRFADGIHSRLERASAETGLPINAVVTVACMEWLERHLPAIQAEVPSPAPSGGGWLGSRLWGRRHQLFDRLAPETRDVLERSEGEARALGHAFVGTEHLLLSILADAELPATQALSELGVVYPAARHEVERIVGRGGEPSGKEIVLTGRAKAALERAAAEAVRAGALSVGPEHLLHALVDDAKGAAAGALAALGVGPAALRTTLDGRGSWPTGGSA